MWVLEGWNKGEEGSKGWSGQEPYQPQESTKFITRLRLGKKVNVQCPFLIKANCIAIYNSVVVFDRKSFCLTVLTKICISRLLLFALEWSIWYFARKINQSKSLVSTHIKTVTKNNKFLRQLELSTVGKLCINPLHKITSKHLNFSTVPEQVF